MVLPQCEAQALLLGSVSGPLALLNELSCKYSDRVLPHLTLRLKPLT